MSAQRRNWMPVYIGDYLRDTARLTTEQHGAYLLLMFDYWNSGEPLPDDDEQLASIARMPLARWKKARPILARFFQIADGVWRHKRIDHEIEKASGIQQSRSEAGKTGAAKRWQTDSKSHGKGEASGQQTASQIDAPSPSHIGSVANATDAGASVGTVADLVAEVWKRARGLLAKHDIRDPQAGKLIGKWLKALGSPDSETQLLHILAGAEVNCRGDLIEYVTAAIQRRGQNGKRTEHRNGWAEAIAEGGV